MSSTIPIVENIMNANDLLAGQIQERLVRAGAKPPPFCARCAR
jgi:hypothetical protein